jgi:[acyl-carrier-protein] S-malonyltransferase
MRLPVSGAYHSVYMAPAALKLAECVKGVTFRAPSVPVVSNVDAEAVLVENIGKTLVRQVTDTVLWADCVRRMSNLGADTFIEFGPGKALSGFIKKILPEARVFNVSDVVSLNETLEGLSLG